MTLAGFPFIDVCLSPFLADITSVYWHKLWSAWPGWTQRKNRFSSCVGSIPFCLGTFACYSARVRLWKRTHRVGPLPTGTGLRSFRFGFSPCQSMLDFLLHFGE